ncbi:hypothetical protein BAOM_0921 [Peribacillus asahii]|uniref:Uncharacterized protein n=1 Tax=Peribacillus asahii TaxID=228899 RepID=A0A3Q9RKV0_9BACI|nr:hypothetical protein [Peribacillus asahii]AZV41532.1 hypothetical protein BAOM_0921 [Peribacillus asahii]
MKLPNGVTGFYNAEHNKPATIDEKQFKQICFSLISRNGGKVLDFKEPQVATNFFDVEAKVFNKHLHILLNVHYPYMAFAFDVEFGKITFIDEPELFKQFSPFYNVLDTKELNAPVILRLGSKKSILQNNNELNSAELELIAFWKPERIGEIIFNCWD